MRDNYLKKLEQMQKELLEMGMLCEEAIQKTYRLLVSEQEREELVKAIDVLEREIDAKERRIEADCIQLFLQQQPVASDLRLISSALKMITDLERIGDLAEDIGEVTLFLCDTPGYHAPKQLSYMAEATIRMVRDSIDSFVAKDLKKAHSVIEYDDVVDKLFNETRSELIGRIHESITEAEQAMDSMMIAKYFERIGDHAVNISEWVEFSITGTHKNIRVI